MATSELILSGSHAPPDLTGEIVKLDDHYCDGGSFGDVWKCSHTDSSGSRDVAMKVLRPNIEYKKSVKLLRRELGIWRRLDHKNIVPFLGTASGFGRHISLVSLWMPHGTLQTFISEHDPMLGPAHRFQLLGDIASGLQYLHSFPIIHGDLTSKNVLIDGSYNARLTDFGLASVIASGEIPEVLAYLQISTQRPGAGRYAAPELFSDSENLDGKMHFTTRSDIYSFGNIMLQVLSGKEPWSEIQRDVNIILHLAQGRQPRRPSFRPIDEEYWEVIQHCWQLRVQDRPCAGELIPVLESFLAFHMQRFPASDSTESSPPDPTFVATSPPIPSLPIPSPDVDILAPATIEKFPGPRQESAASMHIDGSPHSIMSIHESPSAFMSIYESPSAFMSIYESPGSSAMSIYASPVHPGMDMTGSTFTLVTGRNSCCFAKLTLSRSSCDDIQEGIELYQSSSPTPYCVDSLCQSSPTFETRVENLQLSPQVDYASLSDALGLAFIPTLPPAQESGTSVFPRSFEELLGWLEPQKPDIMHNLPASVPPGALSEYPPHQQGRAISQSPRAVRPVPQNFSSPVQNTASHSNIPLTRRHSFETAIHSCEWRRDDGSICLDSISFMTCPEHLAIHGIKNMASNLPIICGWCGNTVKRYNIIRHVRERHLLARRFPLRSL
ncbi:hypothetical protein HYDPIDRAFT_112924, partial [Hydnomerulius pinastri MD-312]